MSFDSLQQTIASTLDVLPPAVDATLPPVPMFSGDLKSTGTVPMTPTRAMTQMVLNALLTEFNTQTDGPPIPAIPVSSAAKHTARTTKIWDRLVGLIELDIENGNEAYYYPTVEYTVQFEMKVQCSAVVKVEGLEEADVYDYVQNHLPDLTCVTSISGLSDLEIDDYELVDCSVSDKIV